MKDITLEMTCKGFKKTDPAYIQQVCHEVFDKWKLLLKQAEQASIMLWTGDGSELLDYTGDMQTQIEWCYWVSDAPKKQSDGSYSEGYTYMQDPPKMTYGILKRIVEELKKAGKEILGENVPIRVGTTFDPGPEFAISSFKYVRHNELCSGYATSGNVMICAYENMKADDFPYATFPDGVPEGTPFGTFMGRQAHRFMKDMGFDFIWLSNGFGFGKDTWSPTGVVFDGEQFYPEALEETKQKVETFWKLFTQELGDFAIEVRGTNMSMGMDLARDGVPLKQIYAGDYNLLPPPNSPWAALNGDYGLEVMGYMSRVAKLPKDRYLFRYYIHDPWFLTSPWYDRYNSQPHDIYIPLSVARLGTSGEVMPPSNMHIMCVDNALGNMPDACVVEPLPHLMKAIKQFPDAPAPVVWVYPFDEYSDCAGDQQMKQMYSEDWFVRDAINLGLPLSMVTSTDAFVAQNKSLYRESIIVTPVPKADSPFEDAVLKYVQAGGKVIFYGNTILSGKKFKEFLGLSYGDEISGELEVCVNGKAQGTLMHTPVICGGGICETGTSAHVFATAQGRPIGVRKDNCIWVRGTVSCKYVSRAYLLQMFSEQDYFLGESLIITALGMLGYALQFEKTEFERSPVIMLHRNNNAFIMTVFQDSTTVKSKIRFPFGAPVLDGYETAIEDGFATYHFPKCEHRELRAFVEQDGGIVKCREYPPRIIDNRCRRRIQISGLQNATVRFLGETYCAENLEVQLSPNGVFQSYTSAPITWEYVTVEGTRFCQICNVTGDLVFNMPYPPDVQKPCLFAPDQEA